MKSHEQDRLLNDILAGDDLTNLRQASLEHGLKAMRRQQKRRRVVRACALLMLPMLVTFAILSRRAPEASNRQIASTNPTTAVLHTLPSVGGDTKFINDEELFALFPNRPLALVGKPGQQQLVFLDQTEKNRQP